MGAVKVWRHPEVRIGGPGERRRGGDTIGVGRRSGVDGIDKWGQCVSEGIERRCRERKA
jgi:hypothetical protein